MRCFVYILRSQSGGKYYVGSTQDVNIRLELHNGSKARWTRKHQPWEIVHTEKFETRGEAIRRERQLKQLKGISTHLEAIRAGKA
jgi:putative endonuclease